MKLTDKLLLIIVVLLALGNLSNTLTLMEISDYLESITGEP